LVLFIKFFLYLHMFNLLKYTTMTTRTITFSQQDKYKGSNLLDNLGYNDNSVISNKFILTIDLWDQQNIITECDCLDLDYQIF
jgi:hypothetical protein